MPPQNSAQFCNEAGCCIKIRSQIASLNAWCNDLYENHAYEIPEALLEPRVKSEARPVSPADEEATVAQCEKGRHRSSLFAKTLQEAISPDGEVLNEQLQSAARTSSSGEAGGFERASLSRGINGESES